MSRLDLAERRRFDYRVLSSMRGPVFDFTAYRSGSDLQNRRNPVTDEKAADGASKYAFVLAVRTHVSATAFADVTEIGVDTDVVDYPRKPPNTWVMSPHMPWSPHFRKGSPVCLGEELWPKDGHITLGHLVLHLARLLNWDEKGRGGGYVGWNPEAIAHHQRAYGGRPINPALIYPALPAWLYGGSVPSQGMSFEITDPGDAGMGFQIL